MRTLVPGHRFQDIERRCHADAIAHMLRGLARRVVGRMKNEPAGRLDRPASKDVGMGDPVRQPDRLFRFDHVQLHQQVAKAHPRGRVIDDDPHRPVIRVQTQIDDAATEAIIGHSGHGDEELARQPSVQCTCWPVKFINPC